MASASSIRSATESTTFDFAAHDVSKYVVCRLIASTLYNRNMNFCIQNHTNVFVALQVALIYLLLAALE